MFHLSGCQNCKNINALKVQDHCFENILSKLFCFMGTFRKSVSKLDLLCFNQFSLVILSPAFVQSRSGSEYRVNTDLKLGFDRTVFVLIAV